MLAVVVLLVMKRYINTPCVARKVQKPSFSEEQNVRIGGYRSTKKKLLEGKISPHYNTRIRV